MESKKGQNAGEELAGQIQSMLDEALQIAQLAFNSNNESNQEKWELSEKFLDALNKMSDYSDKASTGFTNIVTCLAIKAAKPNVDIRYHQVQIQNQIIKEKRAGFNFRGISEEVIYPWLSNQRFSGAKSGWQTRTFERPKPYLMSYEENIGAIKKPILTCFNEIEKKNQNALRGLAYIFYKQLLLREKNEIPLAIPKIKDISAIVKIFKDHFSYPYMASKGASPLPVLALYAIYSVMVEELERFKGMELRDLRDHSAADSQTGAVGDIEIARKDTGKIFEALEIKHNIQIDENIVNGVRDKIMDKEVDRYYILTTHSKCDPTDDGMDKKIQDINNMYHCQIIVNGVLPSLRYYLRMLSDPSKVLVESI